MKRALQGGMEYPGIVFDGMTDKGKVLYWVDRA